MNKKINIVILFIIVICLFFVMTTIAYITRNTTANNVITFGNIKMQLMQTEIDKNNNEKEVNNDEIIDITYNSNVSRNVKVKNLGRQEFFVRISLDIIGIDSNEEEFNTEQLTSYDINTKDWIFKEGWYYYKKIVKQNETTSNLITEVEFDIDNITKKYPKGKFKFNIKAEAVQSKNNAENVLEVVGWPSK